RTCGTTWWRSSILLLPGWNGGGPRDRVHHRLEPFDLGSVDSSANGRLQGGDLRLKLSSDHPPLPRQADDDGPAIFGRHPALDQTRRLQPIQHAGRGRRLHSEDPEQVSHDGGLVRPEIGDQVALRIAEAEAATEPLEIAADSARRFVDR